MFRQYFYFFLKIYKLSLISIIYADVAQSGNDAHPLQKVASKVTVHL